MVEKLLCGCLAWVLGCSVALTVVAQESLPMAGLDAAVPDAPLLYSGWTGLMDVQADSQNLTEQLLSEPTVKVFLEDLESRLGKLPALAFVGAPGDRERLVRRTAPEVLRSFLHRRGLLFIEKIVPPQDGDAPVIEGALLLDIGEDAPQVAQSLARLMCEAELQPKTVEVAGLEVFELPLAGTPELVQVGAQEGVVFLALGDETVERMLTRWKQGKRSAWLEKLGSGSGLQRVTSVGKLDVVAIRQLLLDSQPPPEIPQMITALGLDGVTAVEWVGGLDETQLVQRSRLVIDGAPRGILNLFGDKGIEAAELQHVPDDSLFAVGLSLDPEKALDLVETLLGEFSPREAEEMQEGMNQIERQLGIDIRGDLVESIGSTWCLYNGAADGWGSGLTLTVSTRDSARLRKALDALSLLAGTIMAQDRDAPQIRRRKMGDKEFFSLSFSGVPVPVEPSWCVTDDKLVITLFPQSMSPFLSTPLHQPLFSGALPGAASDSSRGAGGKDRLLGFCHTDTRRIFEWAYPAAQMLLTSASGMAGELAREMPNEAGDSLRPLLGDLQLPPARVIYPKLRPALTSMWQDEQGLLVQTEQVLPMLDVTAVAPFATGLMLPAVQQAREAARRTQSANNLKQLLLAMLNYESAFKRFPAGATVSPEGESMLSWRVQMLPYLEQQGLYEQFHHDEPWDSPHNLTLLEQMPEVFRSPASTAGPGMTVYRGIGGPRGVLGLTENGKGIRISQILDGMSNTIAIVEAGDSLAVPWTQPDPGIDPEQLEFYELFSLYPGGTNAGFCDGSVQFLSMSIDWESIKAMMGRDDGIAIPYR